MSDPTEDEVRTLICKFLTSAAFADHLGDVRDSEVYLYEALGIDVEELHEARYEVDGDPLAVLQTLARAHDLPVPDYALEDGDDE